MRRLDSELSRCRRRKCPLRATSACADNSGRSQTSNSRRGSIMSVSILVVDDEPDVAGKSLFLLFTAVS
jgi:hypothetical protein